MDESISNLVLTDMDNIVVRQVSIMDGSYENVAHLVPTCIHPHGPQVVRLTPTMPTHKTLELHPLEAEIQRDMELKRLQQEQSEQGTVCRQNNSVIHSVTEALQSSRRQCNLVQMQHKTYQICPEQVTLHTDGVPVPVQHIVKSDTEQMVAHVLQNGKSVFLNSKPVILVDSTTSIIEQNWEGGRQVEETSTEVNEVDVAQIPLTVQNYSEMEEVQTADTTVLKEIKESDSEDDEDDIQPVKDHEPDPEPDPLAKTKSDKPNKCYVCSKSFMQKKNMYAHIRRIHSAQPKIEGGILCPLCRMHASRQEHLRNHLEELHDIQVEREERLFFSMSEFLEWKEHIERETLSLYVSKSSAKLLANNQQKTYYKCHRSGNYTSDKEHRKKKLKYQGSNKIGATCPAAMEVTENLHGVNVLFWKTHVGHSRDLAHLTLGREERDWIVELLNSGTPWDEVLERIRKETEKKPQVASRLAILSKQDLRNINERAIKVKKNHETQVFPELFPQKKKVNLGRKPVKERMLRRASQSLVIEKAELLLNILETTDVIAEFRPKVCLMIDNLISTVKRRAETNIYNRHSSHKRTRTNERLKKNGLVESEDECLDDLSSGDEASEVENTKTHTGATVATQTIKTETQGTQTAATQQQETVIKFPKKKRGRPKRTNDVQTPKKNSACS